MSAKKNRKPKRLPAIVPRFLKSAVTVGAIPALVSCGKGHHQRTQPVVAQYIEPAPVVAAYAPDRPVETAPTDAGSSPSDAGSSPSDAGSSPMVQPVVAAVVPHPPPPVVAAMVPRSRPPQDAGVDAPAPAPKKPQKSPKATKPPPPPPPRPELLGVAAMFAPAQDLENVLPPPTAKTKTR